MRFFNSISRLGRLTQLRRTAERFAAHGQGRAIEQKLSVIEAKIESTFHFVAERIGDRPPRAAAQRRAARLNRRGQGAAGRGRSVTMRRRSRRPGEWVALWRGCWFWSAQRALFSTLGLAAR
jgi:hypothetical protein